ncbi:hypothetical protein ABDK00_003320 [Niabella insulamsoli]|uniref:hypothetical protein n=1 Tax=Niabella insulamsoli TaxID=3144874 RepID=UPI0031FBE8C2
MIQDANFDIQKKGLGLLSAHKNFYSPKDLHNFKEILQLIEDNFKERGSRAFKKQLLSSKEKEVWSCECGKVGNDLDEFCSTCGKDIFGFTNQEPHPSKIPVIIKERIELISEQLS